MDCDIEPTPQICEKNIKFPIDIMSDLHLEFHPKISSLEHMVDKHIIKLPEDTKDRTLILAGDIGYAYTTQYWSFLESCCKMYDSVICVLGNHEFYSKSSNQMFIDDILNMIKIKRVLYSNLFILMDEIVDFNNFRVIGGTMWTNIEESAKKYVRTYMKDYSMIFKSKHIPITVDDTVEMHKKTKTVMKYGIETSIKPIIVVTHHLCSDDLIHDKYKDNPLITAFSTDMTDIVNDKVVLWVCGHTHSKMNKEIKHSMGKFCAIVNPLGYPEENKHFDLESFILPN
jgi:hypothetical protein